MKTHSTIYPKQPATAAYSANNTPATRYILWRTPPSYIIYGLLFLLTGCSSEPLRWSSLQQGNSSTSCERESVEVCVKLGLSNCATIAKQTCQQPHLDKGPLANIPLPPEDDINLINNIRLQAVSGECLESIVADRIGSDGRYMARRIIDAALLLQVEVGPQQNALGCKGNILERAAESGADPADILSSTAAGALSLETTAAGKPPKNTPKKDWVDELRHQASANRCLESIVGESIVTHGPDSAKEIVNAAYLVLSETSEQQKKLGCSGAIGQAAIAAGADPNEVLAATAAGLGAPGAGSPSGPQSLFRAIGRISAPSAGPAIKPQIECKNDQLYYLRLRSNRDSLINLLNRYSIENPNTLLANRYLALPEKHRSHLDPFPSSCWSVKIENENLNEQSNILLDIIDLTKRNQSTESL